MSFFDAYQADSDQALRAMVASPPPPPKPAPKRNAWLDLPDAAGRVLGTAIPAAAAQVGAAVSEVLTGAARSIPRLLDTPFSTPQDMAALPPVRAENEFSRSLRNVAEEMRPDPTTASTAERVAFDGIRGVGKAVGYVATMGPAGAGAFAVDEGLAAFDDLQRKGVDDVTAAKAGVVSGVAAGAGVLLPIAGPTIKTTAALIAAGGPGLYVAQQAAISEMLKDAGYSEIAEQFDPLDPVGLAVSTLIPAAFGGAHAVKLRVKDGLRPAVRPPNAAPPELVDAGMVQNLTLQEDVRAATPRPEVTEPPPVKPPRLPPEPEPAAPVETKAPPAPKPAAGDEAGQQLAALRERIASIEQADPAVAAAMERVRKDVDEGTDFELGRQDADLMKVAAECALSLL